MLITKILEARKNPAQNKKVDILNYLQTVYDQCELLPNGQRNAFISFVMIEKLGLILARLITIHQLEFMHIQFLLL